MALGCAAIGDPQPVPARESAAQAAPEPLYQPLDFVTVRAPLLPVECYRALADEKRQLELLSDPRVRAALAVGSTSLLGAIDRFHQSGLTRRDADRMRAKLRRYQIRMSTPHVEPGSPSEQRTLSLLLRTRESLAKAPVAPDP